MKEKRLKIKINCLPEIIFNFLLDPKNTPLWIGSIIEEKTNEWPAREGTIYRNCNQNGKWSEYRLILLKPNEKFEMVSSDENYHVRYAFTPNDTGVDLEYHEWVEDGNLSQPFDREILDKLKSVIEGRSK